MYKTDAEISEIWETNRQGMGTVLKKHLTEFGILPGI